jgi:flagellar biosynthesis protein FliP
METPYISALLAIVFLTGFAKVATILGVFKEGLGLKSVGASVAFAALALALSFVAVEPQLASVGGLDQLLSGKPISQFESSFRPYLEKKSDLAAASKIFPDYFASSSPGASESQAESQAGNESKSGISALSFPKLILVFIMSELAGAFKVALALLIPFILIDLLVVQVMVMLSVSQLRASTIALPLKLLLFIAVDGWTLIVKNLIQILGA